MVTYWHNGKITFNMLIFLSMPKKYTKEEEDILLDQLAKILAQALIDKKREERKLRDTVPKIVTHSNDAN